MCSTCSNDRKKLDSKSNRCIFLGYGTDVKGYRLYDIQRKRVIISRDVIFDESNLGFEGSETKQDENRKIKIDIEDQESSIDQEDTDQEEVPVEADEQEPRVRRSVREKRRPDYYGVWVNNIEGQGDPLTVDEALIGANKDKWKNAMEKEMSSLKENQVWDLVELPKGKKAVGSKWVFKRKTDEHGNVTRYKARLVAQGFSQKVGRDYDETFSPIVRFESIRTVISIAAQHNLYLHQLDVATAFLNGELQEEVYMQQPEGFAVKGKEGLVCKLNRSIYGLRQSPRCWNFTLDKKLKEMGLQPTPSDPCLYTNEEGEMMIVAVYVDDILIACKNSEKMEEVKKELGKCFKVNDMGELTYFLGVKIIQNKEKGSIWIGQETYTESILEKYQMDRAKPAKTPVNVSQKLIQANEDDEEVDRMMYQSAVGSLLYLSTRTRPDIAYAVSTMAKFSSKPTKAHWTAIKRILRYLKGSVSYGLLYNCSDMRDCEGYSDADWGGDVNDYKSTSGYVFMYGGAAVSWKSKKQTSTSLSTAEAEYTALCSAAQEACWLKQLLSDLRYGSSSPMMIHEDNQSAICMTKNHLFHGRTKHISIKYHFIRELVADNIIKVVYCPTEEMMADVLTKGLSQIKFEKLRQMIGVTNYHK